MHVNARILIIVIIPNSIVKHCIEIISVALFQNLNHSIVSEKRFPPFDLA